MLPPPRPGYVKPSSRRPPPEADDGLADYRKQVQDLASRSQEQFDKTVLALSGGALGVSFVFLKDVVGANPIFHPTLLFGAWMSWGGSATAILGSYFVSHMALRHTVKQINQGTIWRERAGGAWTVATGFLNIVGALLFLLGLVLIARFAGANFNTSAGANGNATSPTAVSASAAAASSSSSPSTAASSPTASAASSPRGNQAP